MLVPVAYVRVYNLIQVEDKQLLQEAAISVATRRVCHMIKDM